MIRWIRLILGKYKVEIKNKENENQALMTKALAEIKKLQQKIKAAELEKNEPIAIIGMSCRFPGGVQDADAFWDLLENGKDAIGEVPKDRWNIEALYDKDPQAKGKIYTKLGGFIDDVEGFDYSFFGITPIEAKRMDPQQRLLMELSWEALEDAKLIPNELNGSKTGVFVGISGNDYLQLQTKQCKYEEIDPYVTTGWAHSVASGRLSYSYGFEGPSMAVDTACSSSLVAVDLACQHLRSGACDLAMACGVSLMLSPEVSINFSKAKMLSTDGKCKSFDAAANGYVRGEGGGAVILKKLSDAIRSNDQILAVIRGSAVNQDGRSSGLTVPNGPSQERVIRDAIKMANIKPEDVSYIEAHGTGTSLGDPIEANALGNVLGVDRKQKFLVGSVKTNFGHLEAAAGMASLIKTVLCLQKKTLVPTLHFQKINPHIELEKIPMEIVTKTIPWGDYAENIYAGISSFGFSGTNAHLVVSNYQPEKETIEEVCKAPTSNLLKISGHSIASANQQKDLYLKRLQNKNESLEDFVYSANTFKSEFKFRKYFLAKSKDEMIAELQKKSFEEIDEKKSSQNKLAFLFTGQGSQYPHMGKELYSSQPEFKNSFDECAKLFQKTLNIDLLDLVYGPLSSAASLQETIHTQPVLFSIEYALAKTWIHFGVKPNIVLGHSIGEIVAACIAGVFDLKDAVRLVSARAKYIHDLAVKGGMLSVSLEEDTVKKLIQPYKNLSIAAINSLSSVVVSGDLNEINSLEIHCNNEKIRNKKLQVSQAFHSSLLKEMIRPFRKELESINFHAPKIKFVSNITGKLVSQDEITNPDYWCKHILSPVRFYDSLKEVEKQNCNFYLEIGGQGILTELSKKSITANNIYYGGSIKERSNDWHEINDCIGKLFLAGVPFNWHEFYKPYNFKKIDTGKYPFQRIKTWFNDRQIKDPSHELYTSINENINSQKSNISNFDTCHQMVDEYSIYLLWDTYKHLFDLPISEPQLSIRLEVQDKYIRLYKTLLELLLNAGFIEKKSDGYFSITEKGNSSETIHQINKLQETKNQIIEKFADSRYMFELLHSCVRSLNKVLSGKIKSVEAMFPGGDVSMVENVYKKNEILRIYSQLVASCIKKIVDLKLQEKPNDKIRILEIGAGTGGTSAFVFEEIDSYASQLHYCYTDISGGFLQHGKTAYGKTRPYVEFKLLDVEKEIASQNIDLGSYDLVFASNVIHATKRIDATIKKAQSLLKKSGVLLLNETTKVLNFTTLTFGLADGWWLFEDDQVRLPYSPLLSSKQWSQIFKENQFGEVKTFGCQLEHHEAFQHLIYGVNYLEAQKPNLTNSEQNVAKKALALHESAPKYLPSVILTKVKEITKEASGIEIAELKADVNLFELGLDSLMLMAMKDRIEKEFSVVMDTGLFYEETDTLQKICNYIENNSSSSNMPAVSEQIVPSKTPKRQVTERTSSRPHLRGFKLEKDNLTPQQQSFVDQFMVRYNKRTLKSKQYAADSKNNCADWINSLGFRLSLKEIAYPVVMKECYDARFVDLDGNEYIDFAMGYGVGFFGNNISFIRESIQNQLNKGFELGPQNHLIGKVSELICEMTKVDRVSYCNSGTEAVMVALRLARTATKRSKIVFFSGSYHGTFDGILAFPSQKGYGAETQVIGTPEAMMEDIMILPYGDEKSLEIIKSLGDELAGVLVEPVQSRNPSLQPKEFLHKLRTITKELGAVLIFDEVLLGFRICQGGAQKYFGVTADIVTYGKIVGGGMPIGVVAGTKAIMDFVDGGVWQFGDLSVPRSETTVFQGTFCKHPLAMAAAHAVLTKMKADGPTLQEKVNQLTDNLAKQVNQFFENEKLPIKLSHFGSVFKFDTSGRLNPLLQPIEMDLFYLLLIEKGIYTWEKRICFLSLAHTQQDVDCFVQKIVETIKELKAHGFLNDFSSANKTLVAESLESSFVASTVQKRLFSLKAFDQGKSPYQLTAAFTHQGKLRIENLENAINRVYMRHPLLRSRFEVQKDGEIFIKYRSDFHFKLSLNQSGGKNIDALIDQSELELDLVKGPAFKIALFEIEKDKHLLVFTTHHCVIDGLSWDLFIQDLLSQLELKNSYEIKSSYENFIKWQQEYFLSETYKKDKDFWLNQFSGELPLLELPADFARPPRKSGKGGIVFGNIDKATVTSLKEVAKKNSCTINMLLLGIYSLFLNKLSNQNDIVIGMPISGRPNKEFDTVIGMFANSIALPLQMEDSVSFVDFITQVKNKTLNAYQHQSYPFERLVEHVVKNRDLSRNPIFDTMFVFEKGERRILKTNEFNFEAYPLKKDISPYDLALEMIEQNGEMSLNFEFNSDIFRWETLKQWQSYLINLFQEVIKNSNLKIGEYQLWSDESQNQFLQKVNNTKMDFGLPTTLVNLFEQSLQKNPNEIFTINGSVARTYLEIDELSNGVAQYLISNNLIGANIIVHIEKSDNYIPIIIGIMKAGSCFVPVEAKFSAERLLVITEDCHASLVIVDESLSNKLNGKQLWITPKQLLNKSTIKRNLSEPQKPAYIIYTSGSTGKPKGVVVWHETICNNMLWRARYYQMNKNDSVLQLASYSFDSSLAEILPIMCTGGSVIFFNESDRLDIEHLSNLIENHQISLITTTPSFYDAFLVYLEADNSLSLLNSLRSITLAGEETSLGLLQKHQRLFPHISLVNEYGPTENSICGTVFRFENENVSIGKPIGNNKIFVWNKNNQICPPGVLGQIVVSGLGVTAGYLNRQELTDKVFLSLNNERFYLTGDLGVWDINGNLYFKGRIDDQVKIRGYRIELGEIKARIDAIASIKESVVNVFNDMNGKAIVAYYVLKPNASLLVNEIKETLLKFLPPYMVPSYFMELKEIPLNNSGKVNKNALPSPLQAELNDLNKSDEDVSFEPPRDFKEIIIAEVWEQVLNHSPIGIRDNYFHLGGDSIKAIQVMGKLSAKGFIFKVPDLFENPTIAQLAKVIELTNTSGQPVYQKIDSIGEYSLSPIQKWFLNNNNVHKNHFNQSVLLETKFPVNIVLLNQAVQYVLEKHAALRSNFGLIGDQIKAIISDKAEEISLNKISISNQLELMNHLSQLQEGFDLVAQPLIRFSLIQFNAKELLFITAHHLVVDVISWRIILDDISSFYQLLDENKEVNTAIFNSQIPFKKWTEILMEYSQSETLLSEKSFWQNIEDKIPFAKIPNEEGLPLVAGIETFTQYLNAELSSQLIKTANKAYHTEINDLFMTAIYRAFQNNFSKNKVAIDVELHGRQGINKETPDLNQTVGWFTSMYPVYLEVADNFELGQQIKEIKEQIRAVPNKGLGYGILKYLSEKISGDHTPSISLNYLGQLDDGFDNSLFKLLPESETNSVSKHRYLDHTVELEIYIQNQELVIKTHFRSGNGIQTWMNLFAETFKNELVTIINHCTNKETAELTPNDLTFKGLSIEELDSLFD